MLKLIIFKMYKAKQNKIRENKKQCKMATFQAERWCEGPESLVP